VPEKFSDCPTIARLWGTTASTPLLVCIREEYSVVTQSLSGTTQPWSQTSSTCTTDDRRRAAGLSQQQPFSVVQHFQ